MREILFRGNRIVNGEWVEGGYYHDLDREGEPRTFILPKSTTTAGHEHRRVYAETVGQFTGLLDKTGKKIFEGDIVAAGMMDWTEIGKIEWCQEQFRWKIRSRDDGTAYGFGDTLQAEIIGNIHDTPELMTTEQ